jgi:hypothetical protein
LVCDPRKNALIKVGNKSDRIDARKLADLLPSANRSRRTCSRFGVEDFHQRGIPNRGRPTETLQEIPGHIRGLNTNHNHDLKNIFKGAATRAAAVPGPFQDFHAGLVARGMKPTMARLTRARLRPSL